MATDGRQGRLRTPEISVISVKFRDFLRISKVSIILSETSVDVTESEPSSTTTHSFIHSFIRLHRLEENKYKRKASAETHRLEENKS